MNDFQKKLEEKMDVFAHEAYRLTKNFPPEERYGSASQLRRAALSVIVNYTEGFARQKNLVKKNFWETSYGSLKESMYLIRFCEEENYYTKEESKYILSIGEEIGAMLWKLLRSLH